MSRSHSRASSLQLSNFHLKRRTPAYRRSWRSCSNAFMNPRCRSRCGSIWTAARRPLPVPAVQQGRRSRSRGRSLPLCWRSPLTKGMVCEMADHVDITLWIRQLQKLIEQAPSTMNTSKSAGKTSRKSWQKYTTPSLHRLKWI